MQYMRAHGNTPGPVQRPVSAGAISAVLATVPAALVLWISGALQSLSDRLGIGSELVLAIFLVCMSVVGGLYGRVFSRAANDRRAGWLFGISYGFLIWMIGPVMILQLITRQPAAIGTAALGLLGAHLVFGVTLGLLFPSVHKLLQPKSGRLDRQSQSKPTYEARNVNFAPGEGKKR